MTKWVYTFGDGKAEGRGEMRNLLGGKGANLAEMANLGLPVPPGFTITTEVCTSFYANGKAYPAELGGPGRRGARGRSARSPAATFGDLQNPLLVSVRSGARASMPGMMDTVLNLGLNDADRRGAGEERGRRALRLGFLPPLHHRCIPTSCWTSSTTISRTSSTSTRIARATRSTPTSPPTTGRPWSSTTRSASSEETGKPFPQDPHDQLWGAIGAVFGSWMNQRAITYRRLNDIPESWGTAVNVQAMVFGNMGETSATGVAFTRNPVHRREANSTASS